jgi:hypothetical protein
VIAPDVLPAPPAPYFLSTDKRAKPFTHRFHEWWELTHHERERWTPCRGQETHPTMRCATNCYDYHPRESYTILRPKAICGQVIVHPRYSRNPVGTPCDRCEEVLDQEAARVAC